MALPTIEELWNSDAGLDPIEKLRLENRAFSSGQNALRQPNSALGTVFDVLNRPIYASRKLISVLGDADASTNLFDAIAGGAKELFSPEERLTSEDLIRQFNPDFYNNNKRAAYWLGFAADVVFDPLNFVSFGAGSALRAARSITGASGEILHLSKFGQKTLGELTQEGIKKHGTGVAAKEYAEDALRERLGDLPGLIDRGGVKVFGNTVLDGDQFRKMTGIDALSNAPFLKTGVDRFKDWSKDFAIDFRLDSILEKHYPQMARWRRHYEAEKANVIKDSARFVEDIFGTGKDALGAESRSRIQMQMDEILAEASSPDNGFGGWDSRAFATLLEQNRVLTKDEKTAVRKLQALYSQIGELETFTIAADRQIARYHPQYFEATTDPSAIERFWLGLKQEEHTARGVLGEGKVNTRLDQFLARNGMEVDDATPITDAGVNLLLTLQAKGAAKSREAKEAFLKSTFPKYDGSIESLPKAIRQDLSRLDISWGNGLKEDESVLWRMMDTINGVFRKSATVVNPAFSVKQGVGGIGQVMISQGMDGVRFLDSIPSAFRALSGDTAFKVKDVFGNVLDGEEVLGQAQKLGVLKGVGFEGAGATSHGQLMRNMLSDVGQHYKPSFKAPPRTRVQAIDGLKQAIRLGERVLDFPAVTEDTIRMAGFMNALGNGHTFETAAKVVDDTFFNYSSGLTKAEQSIRSTILPFYTFTKFGTELAVRTLGTRPGTVQQAGNLGEAVLSAFSQFATGETLSDKERFALPGYLLEQPRAFQGFDEESRAIFRTFSGYNFMEVLNFWKLGEDGAVDFGETFSRSILGAMAPMLKMPLEAAMNREMFSGRALDGARAGNVGNIDPDAFLRSLGFSLGLQGGATTGGLGAAAGQAAGFLPGTEKLLKKFLSWEETTDPQTGKQTVYINPFMAYSLASVFPAFKRTLKLEHEDNTAVDNALYLFGNVGTQRRDLPRDYAVRLKNESYEQKKLRSRIRNLQKAGRFEAAQREREALRTLIERMANERRGLTGTLRG